MLTCVPSLTELVRAHTDLDSEDLAWLQLLLADWQIIADLSFADLVLWLPDREDTGYWAVAQMRPTTGPTAYVDDLVGAFVPKGRRPLIDSAHEHQRVAREGDPEWRDDIPVRVEAIPVRRGDRILGIIARNTNLLGVRTPSRLELSYLQTATDLTQMIAGGHFPFPGQRSDHADSPRVGDGFVRIDATGRVTYASPNALSVYRRLGLTADLTGLNLADTTRELVPPARRPDEETLSAVLGGTSPRDTETGNDQTMLILRAIPLRPTGEHLGALVLLRDVTELRRRDRELVTKDATIREIHHRVKNNLQTVAALLRLQARRIDSAEGREALEEAVRRVGSIAIVHETLSQAFDEFVDFDDVADRLRVMVAEVSSRGGGVHSRAAGQLRHAHRGGRDAAGDGRSPRCSRTPWSTGSGEEKGTITGHRPPAGGPADGDGAGRRARTAGRFRPGQLDQPGPVDRADPRGVRAGRSAGDGARARAGHPGGGRHPDPSGLTAQVARDARVPGDAGGRDQAVRTLARALRRLSARRSSSLIPPQTPWSCPASRAHARHCSRTSQRRHTCLASSIWRMAGPVLPIGKNSSGSSSRHAERWRQSMADDSFISRGGGGVPTCLVVRWRRPLL